MLVYKRSPPKIWLALQLVPFDNSTTVNRITDKYLFIVLDKPGNRKMITKVGLFTDISIEIPNSGSEVKNGVDLLLTQTDTNKCGLIKFDKAAVFGFVFCLGFN